MRREKTNDSRKICNPCSHTHTHTLTLSNVQSTQTMASVIYLMHTSLRIPNMIGNLLTFHSWHCLFVAQFLVGANAFPKIQSRPLLIGERISYRPQRSLHFRMDFCFMCILSIMYCLHILWMRKFLVAQHSSSNKQQALCACLPTTTVMFNRKRIDEVYDHH